MFPPHNDTRNFPSITPEYLAELTRRAFEVEQVPTFNFDYAALEHEAIKDAAYFKWVNAGYPDDMDLVFWLEAEKEYKGKNWL